MKRISGDTEPPSRRNTVNSAMTSHRRRLQNQRLESGRTVLLEVRRVAGFPNMTGSVEHAWVFESEEEAERFAKAELGPGGDWEIAPATDTCEHRANGLELLGVDEVARRLGVKPNTVYVWRQRHDDFPQPLTQLAAGPVWWAPDVTRWAQSREEAAETRAQSNASVSG